MVERSISMKKILSVLLSAAIIIGVVGIGVCAEERESDLGFAVASGIWGYYHVWHSKYKKKENN